MNKIFKIFFILFFIFSCSTSKISNLSEIVYRAENSASFGGRKIIETSNAMITNQEIILGGCWDYINAVYNRAGYPANLRDTIYKSKLHGPYTNADQIIPGDWLYFVNHSYFDTEHSGIFLAWINKDKKEAVMISYEGEKRKRPATFKKYTLTNIYNIIRAHDK